VVELVGQLLAKDPLARPADGYEVVRRLREAAVAVGPLSGLDELGEWLTGLEARTASPWTELGDFMSGAGLGVDDLLGFGLGRVMAGGGGRERTVTAIGSGGSGLQPVGDVVAVVPLEASLVAPVASVVSPVGDATAVVALPVVESPPDPTTRSARGWVLGLMGLGLLLGGAAFALSSAGQEEVVAGGDASSLAVKTVVADVRAQAAEGPDTVGPSADGAEAVELAFAGEDVASTSVDLDVSGGDDVAVEDTDVAPLSPTDPQAPDLAGGETVDFEIMVAAPTVHQVRVETDPPGGRVTISGLGSGRSPYSAEAAQGTRLTIRATLDGFEGRSAVVAVDGPEIVRLRLTPSAKGEVRFRVLPADSVVSLDGVKVDMGSGGVVVGLSVSVGTHRLSVRAPSGATEERFFEVVAGETKNLRTIVVHSE